MSKTLAAKMSLNVKKKKRFAGNPLFIQINRLFRGCSLRKEYPYWSYSGSYFPSFGLNTERHKVSLRIQSECGKTWTRITPNTDTFHAVVYMKSGTGLKTRRDDFCPAFIRRFLQLVWDNQTRWDEFCPALSSMNYVSGFIICSGNCG